MKLFILNDDVNTFEYVVESIQTHLSYPNSQASSIANIVHNTGQCLVKTSSDKDDIRDLHDLLKKEGLKVRVED